MRYIIMLLIVIGLAIADYLTYIIKTYCKNNISSSEMRKVGLKKLGEIIVMMTACSLDIGINALGKYYESAELSAIAGKITANAVFIYITVMEVVSLLENYAEINPNAQWVLTIVKRLKGFNNDKEELFTSTYKYTDKTQLTAHFNVSEFRCKCGENHDTLLDIELVNKLEQLFAALKCSKIIINSGYRCPTHDKNIGGNGYGQHTKGTAADIVCYDKDGKIISSKIVCCAAQNLGFGGIANIDSTYTATHIDTRSGLKWYGDEVMSTDYNIASGDFYKYYNLSKTGVYGSSSSAKRTKTVTLTIDGVTYEGTLTEK